MARPGPPTCPPPEVLGAYIEGKVDAPTRMTIQRHIASCPECIFIVGETSAFLTDESNVAEDEAEPSRGWTWAAALAAVVVACFLAAAWLLVKRDPLANLRTAAAAARTRPVEGRLDGFVWVPYAAARSDAIRDDAVLRLRAESLANSTGDNARAWHARATAALVLKRFPEAIRMFQIAAALEPRQASYWNDLAVAYIAAVARSENASELRDAVSAATRAAAIDPSFAAAQFNLAVALQHLGDARGAARAYDRCLALDPRSRWAAETRTRRALLPR